MDPATLIGLLLAFGSLYAMITLEGAHVSALLIPAPMILVFGATIAVGLASTTLKDGLAFKTLPRAFTGKAAKPQVVIDRVVELAEKARSEGLLALDAEATEEKDPFLQRALQNIADGTDGEELRILLEDEIEHQSPRRSPIVQVLHEHGRLRADHRHHRHSRLADPRAGKPLHPGRPRAR